MKILLFTLFTSLAFAQLPDTPQPQPKTWEEAHGKPATFIAFRSKWTDPPLRTNRQTFRSRIFLLSQAGLVVSMIAACRNPRSHEDWGSEAPAVGGIVALDYLSERMLGETYATAPAWYATVHYLWAATK